jgi:hypothetical protein
MRLDLTLQIKTGFKLYRPGNPWSFVNALYWCKRI